jgi:hypothetical protein
VLVEREAHYLGVEVDPAIHLVPAHVAHHVIDVEQARRASNRIFGLRAEARQECAVVVCTLDEGVDGVTVGGDRGDANSAVRVLQVKGLADAARAAFGGFFPGLAGVVDPQGYVADAITVGADMFRDVPVGTKRGGQHETDFALLQDVGGAIADAGFRTRIGDKLVAKSQPVEISRLAGIAHPEFNVVGAVERQKILLCGDFRLQRGGHNRTNSWGYSDALRKGLLEHTTSTTIYPRSDAWPVVKAAQFEATHGAKVATRPRAAAESNEFAVVTCGR